MEGQNSGAENSFDHRAVAGTIITKLKEVDSPISADPKNLLTLSEFRHELGIPLILAKKLVIWGLVQAVVVADGSIRITETEVIVARKFVKNPWKRSYLYLKALGPGLITGASDDDPGGIGTYSSVGAKYGYGLLWMAAWLLPMMLAVQETCARIGIVTNRGLASVLRRHYNKKIVFGIVLALIVANVVNIGADIGAMAASLQLLLPVNFILASVIFTCAIILIEVFVPYKVYAQVLKWLTISVFAYIAAGLMAHLDWGMVMSNAVIPHITFSKEYIFALIAVFGTSITPYLFFWQTSEEVEESKAVGEDTTKLTPYKLHHRIARMRTDVNTGMILANVVFFFIIITCAKVLFQNGITNIDSAEQAALALKPFAGNFAFLFFALGIIGTGLLAVPILAGSGAYALAELLNWREGLDNKLSRAKGFYFIITISIMVGLLLNFIGVNPIKALFYSAWLNGVIAIPLLFVIMIAGNDPKIMGKETHPKWVKFFGWISVIFATAAILASIYLIFVK